MMWAIVPCWLVLRAGVGPGKTSGQGLSQFSPNIDASWSGGLEREAAEEGVPPECLEWDKTDQKCI